ncbi:S-acyltransferase [Chloropicon primus]|nr:S-acyltransferase [Chloropicon primus]UPR04699.1 S-acyltransferase [Chloropicon primus]|eukprot:QDZ25502.1 S-acyltransferase [Chloropicon primus]
METKQKTLIDTLSKACAYGDLDRLGELLKEKDYSLLSTPDAEGYYPLQWAALNNQVHCAKYLLEDSQCRKHVNIDAKDNTTGQTALHWAAVRGCVNILEVLHDFDASFTVKDNKGYTCAHVAAQYGQTAFLYYMKMKCKADIVDVLDDELRSTLHWACYQGHGDTAKLLLYLGSDLRHVDKEKCSPLHWAAIKGNGHITHMLLQSASLLLCEDRDDSKGEPSGTTFQDAREEYLLEKDGTGSNAIELAKQKGHAFVATQMEKELRRTQAWTRKNKIVKTIMDLEFLPILVSIIVLLLIGYTKTIVFIDKKGENAPATANSVFWWFIVLVPSVVGLGFLYQCRKMDPGFLLTGQTKSVKRKGTYSEMVSLNGSKGMAGGDGNGEIRDAEDDLLFPASAAQSDHEIAVDMDYDLDSAALWTGNWNQICPTCRIVKPLRAKHDSMTNRCVEHFDHHCPWVGNAIGKENRWHFLVFLILQMWALVISVSMAIYKLSQLEHASPNTGYVVGFLVMDVSLTISVLTLLSAQINSIAKNMTTNEMANIHRYNYIAMDSYGRVFNPFDKGCNENCFEVFHPSRGRSPVTLDEDMQHKIRDWIMDKQMHPGPPCCRKV